MTEGDREKERERALHWERFFSKREKKGREKKGRERGMDGYFAVFLKFQPLQRQRNDEKV